MQFLMLVCLDTEPVPPQPTPSLTTDEWVERTDASGTRIVGDVLEPEASATTVRVRDGEVVVTDGPYLETKEILCGFDLLECADRDEAVRIAAQHPMASSGVLELRPIMVF